jgi:hypothetical protein
VVSWCTCTCTRQAPSRVGSPSTWMPSSTSALTRYAPPRSSPGAFQDDLHMRMQPPDADNVGHRFIRDDGAIVDVLAADFGERSRPHTTIPPARTVEVPGGRGLLADAQHVRVIHDGRSGVVERPSLIAAIVGKWRAFAEIAVHSGDPDRHLRDAARLLTVLDPDVVAATRGQRKHLRGLLAEMEARPELAGGDGDLVIDTLTLLIHP